jgi:hypothetical protein
MKLSLLVSIIPLISTVICGTKEDFEKFCKDTYGPDYTASLDASGNPVKCVDSKEKCFGNAYKDPADGKEKCCSVYPVNTKWSYDPVSKTGSCCPTDQKWSYDATSKTGGCCGAVGHAWKYNAASSKGSCCTTDKIFDGANCVTPITPVPDPCPGKPAVAFCHGKVACPTETDLGIQYGKCYVLSFPDGKQLGRQPNRAYEKAGRWQDIPFKVCSSTFDCKAGVPVGLKDSFSLQDQLGIPEDPTGAQGWINNFSGGSHKAFTPDKAQAAIFKGRPGCIGDGCSICINTDPKGLTIACPDALPGLTSVNNPNYCQRMIFEEVQCLS